MAETDEPKPIFGPLMSPKMFKTKWYTKIQSVLSKDYFGQEKSSPIWICNFCDTGFVHLFHFFKQAAEHDLTPYDFPQPKRPDIDFENFTLENCKEKGLEDMDDTNPFGSAGCLMGMVDTKLRRLEAMKTKGDKMRGVAWSQLPLRNRQKVNDLLVAVDEARRLGWWKMVKEQQDLLMKAYREAEAMGVWM